jgi:hypothetical protein
MGVMKRILLLALISIVGMNLTAQNVAWTMLPETLRRPQKGEAPRYPKDTVIGDLALIDVPDAAHNMAKRLLTALVAKDREDSVLAALDTSFLDGVLATIEPLEAQKYRLGGGKTEADGSVSFLLRVIGHQAWVSGELYLKFEHETWLVDDLILETPVVFSAPSDTPPYERVF